MLLKLVLDIHFTQLLLFLLVFIPGLNVTKMDHQIEEIIRRVLMIKEPTFIKSLARRNLDG